MTDLDDLGDDELREAGLKMAALMKELRAARYPRAARWTRYQALRIANEMITRANKDPDPMPELVTLSDCAPIELRRLHDRMQTIAVLEGADPGSPVAAWWEGHCRRCAAMLDHRERDTEALRSWIADRRRERPHGEPA